MQKRIFTNPVIGDKVILIKTSEETNGEYTLFEIEVVPGGGNTLHIHESFSEKFEVLEGELSLQQGKSHQVLKKGESAIVPQKASHCFKNKTDKTVKFNVEFRPAQPGFEKGIAIVYGLAEDGMVNKKSIPKKLSHLAILVAMGGTVPAGAAKLFMPLFHWIARRSRDTELELVKRYC